MTTGNPVMLGERRVAIFRDPELRYPSEAPFDPPELYPEYLFGPEAICLDNQVYAAVRQILELAGLDKSHFGTPLWNPFGDFVSVGGTVVIKPNWVRHYHLRGENVFSLITHPSVLRPLVDYAFRAVGPSGSVRILDAPLFDADYDILKSICQLDKLQNLLRARGIPLIIADIRSLAVNTDQGVVVERNKRDDWPSQGIEFNLDRNSEFVELGESLKNIFGSDYDRRITSAFHAKQGNEQQIHCYKISKRVLEADLVISVPKMKTHKKTGVSLNIKNMIGINTDKNYIPHYRVGAPSNGGDEFPDTNNAIRRVRRWMVRNAIDIFLGRFGQLGAHIVHTFMASWLPLTKERLERKNGKRLDPIDVFYQTVQGDTLRTGNWWGNDTCWRSGLDINKILYYGMVDGRLNGHPVRRYFSLVDGIIGGEGDGPVAPTPRNDGVLIAGFDPISVDIVATQVMGFVPDLIRDITQGEQITCYRLTQSEFPIRVYSNWQSWEGEIARGSSLEYKPHDGWKSYLGELRW